MMLELDPRILDELKTRHKAMEEKQALLSEEQLARFYQSFRARFGPDRLKTLNGEELLETMHTHGNKDSLVYWLEFKDDDEFSSPAFGSISGGSAYKFGLFRKKENRKWVTGSPNNEQELTLDQAIQKATSHRDQLLKGVELLNEFPINGTDADYGRLQRTMNAVAPEVSNLAWGHKYFYLISPEKLDDFHNPDYQRFHLLKLLQLPPLEEGRYIAAGRFVAIANLLDIPMNNLTAVLNERDGGTPYTCWRISTPVGASRHKHWEEMRQSPFASIGWPQVGDLTTIANSQAGKEQIRQALQEREPDWNPPVVGRAAQQLFHFRWSILPGDLILASDGATILGIGKVRGNYQYDPSDDCPHRRQVEWLSQEAWQQPDQQPDIEGKLTTVHRMTRPRNLLEVEKRIYQVPPPPPEPTSRSTPPLQGIPARIQAILERKGQVILYGPPGTGKTYWADKTAWELAARSRFGIAFDQLTQEQQATLAGQSSLWSKASADAEASPLLNVFLKDSASRELAQKLTAAGMLEIRELREGLSLASTSYVGRITLGDIEITIHPKIRGAPLVHLLRYAYGLRDLHIITEAAYEGEDQALQDILISQLITEASELLARGLQRRYVCTDEQLSSPRGKIDLQRMVKQGGVMQATVPCTYYPRLEDHLVNQVLCEGLRLAARLTSDRFLRIHLSRLAGLFQESVSAIRLDFHALKQVHRAMNRLTAVYRPAITVIEMLLAGEGISLDEERHRLQLPGFLFDMNLFFQTLLSRFLNEHLEGYEIRDQSTIKGMMRYHPSYNPRGRRAPTPRPDVVMLQSGQVVSILDAKYRDLWEHDLPAHWLYQLAIYALSRQQEKTAAILYPTTHNEAQEARILLSEPLFGTGQATVVLRPLNLLRLDQLLTDASTAKSERERAAFARWLAFGAA